MSAISIRVLKSVEQLELVRALWEDWGNHPNSAWRQYQLVLSYMPGVIKPYVVTAYRGDSPECFVIGRLELNPVPFKLGYYDRFRPRLKALSFMHEGILGDISHESADLVIERIRRGLVEEGADVAILNSYRVDSALYLAAVKAVGSRFGATATSTRIHRSMSLAASVEDFWSRLSAKARKNLRRQCRQLEAAFAGRLLMKCYQESEHVDAAIQDAELVAKTTYQRAMRVGFQDDEFTRRRMHLQARQGEFLGFVLTIDGTPCAFWLGSVRRSIFYSSSMGYNSAYASHSPGMYLIVKAIESMIGRQTRQAVSGIDFGQGDAQYKTVLGDAEWHEGSVYLFASSLRGQFVRGVFVLFANADRVGRWVLEKSKRLGQIRKWWRGRLRETRAKSGY